MLRMMIRHGEQQQIGGECHNSGPPLTMQGFIAAILARDEIRRRGYKTSVIACSWSLRAYETAEALGAKSIVKDSRLNGTCPNDDASRFEVANQLDQGDVPALSLAAADRLLADPPKQNVLVMHNEGIAGVLALTGQTELARNYSEHDNGRSLIVPHLSMFEVDF